MNKQILILNGSPRLNGNTAALCHSFANGCKEQGHMVTQFNLARMQINGCLGCMQGGKHEENPCVQKDDMRQIYPVYQKADVVVLASPMYYWGFSGQLKTVFDRLFAVAELNKTYQNPQKDCYLIMAAEGDLKENWEPVLHYYHALLKFLDWRNCGEILAGGVMQAGDIEGHSALNEAFMAGKAIESVSF